MTVSVDDLASFIGVNLNGTETEADHRAEESRISSALASAEIEIELALERAFRPVPTEVRDRLVLEVGHAYYRRSDSPTGSSQGVDFGTGQPVPGPRDPLAQVWPIVRRYTLPF